MPRGVPNKASVEVTPIDGEQAVTVKEDARDEIGRGLAGEGIQPEEVTTPQALNEHIAGLVRLFFQQEVQALEQRITDLEVVLGAQSFNEELPAQYAQVNEAPWYYNEDPS